MKDYIKPTFTLAGLFPVAMAASGCNSTSDDLSLLKDILGIPYDDKAAFAMAEADCTDKYDVEQYCKYTSVAEGDTVIKILGS